MGGFDPARHESHLVALFPNEAAASAARTEVLATGLPPDRVTLLADAALLHAGQPHPVQALFVPEDDYHDFHHAIGRGHALLVVRPDSAAARDGALAALERAAPMDMDAHGRRWRGVAGPPPQSRFSVNHANVSRADMSGRAVGGRDEVILDMTGQKMTVRVMSEADMTAAPFARVLLPAERPVPLAPPPPPREQPTRGTSYTYGVPPEVAARMSAEEQVMAQPHSEAATSTQGQFLRAVGGQTVMGWRDAHPGAIKVRSYVSERPDAAR